MCHQVRTCSFLVEVSNRKVSSSMLIMLHVLPVLLQVLLLGKTSTQSQAVADGSSSVAGSASHTQAPHCFRESGAQQQFADSQPSTQAATGSSAVLQPAEAASVQSSPLPATQMVTRSGLIGSNMPSVAKNILAYSLWGSSAADVASTSDYSKTASAAYNESEWLKDMEQLQHQAQIQL